ncbi:MAG: hypothetical protein ACLPQS_14595 [Acidimicrobiales bacterium]
MADVRKDFTRTAQDLSRVAQDAAYVAIGLGVVGFNKAQVARRELLEQIEKQRLTAEGPVSDVLAQMTEVRAQVAKAWAEFDKTLGQLIERADATFEPVAEKLPAQAQAVVKQARETRDQLRGFIAEQLAA